MDELWALTKHSINSDLNTPLNQLMKTLTAEEKTLINNVISKLDNSTYGLSALKSAINNASNYASSANNKLSRQSYPNVTCGRVSTSSTTISGKGIVTLYCHDGNTVNITIDGTNIDGPNNGIFVSSEGISFVSFSFEKSISFKKVSKGGTVQFIAQTA